MSQKLLQSSGLKEFIISGIGDTISKYVPMATSNTPYNFFSPIPGYEFFIITLIVSGPATVRSKMSTPFMIPSSQLKLITEGAVTHS